MERRIRPVRAVSMLILAVALLLTGPTQGWWTLLPLVVSAAGFAAMDRGLESAPRPEYRLAGAWLLAEFAIAGSVALSGGPRSPAVAWIAIPVVTLGARFSHRGVMAGLGCAAVLILLVTVGVDPSYIGGHPSAVIFPVALLGAIAVLSTALMSSDLHHRGAAAIDPLTGMLNRNALIARVGELAHQAVVARQPVGMIVGDLDHFKSINDAHGHAAGDAVLRDVADRLRESLRAFDLAYRVGGEEFLVLLPGSGLEQTQKVAEELRLAVSARPLAGLLVSMSCGVTASPPAGFDYETAFAAADVALYEAKHSGRDSVRVRALDQGPAGELETGSQRALLFAADDDSASRAGGAGAAPTSREPLPTS
jgi:diguanylate cyclase (GGDEF)-like protein